MMLEQFRFQVETHLIFGCGQSKKLGQFLSERRLENVLVLVDEGVEKHSAYFREVMGLMRAVATVAVETLRSTEEPDYDYLDAIVENLRRGPCPDIVIGIGGGSAMDIAKAAAMLLRNPGRGLDYRGFDKVQKPAVPTLLIPTTAGTGSEVTINAVFTDKKEMRKLGINGRYMNATWALLDAEWTMSCPPAAALSAGMDAVVHSLESFMCRQHNGLTRILSKEAFRLLYQNLPSLNEDPGNLERRQNLLLGAYLAAMALFNSGSGIAGALSYPLGVNFKVPHGICGAIFLPSVIAYNVKAGYADYAELLDAIEPGVAGDALAKSRQFVDVFNKFSSQMGVPESFGRWNITERHLDELGKLVLPLQAAFDQNPVPFSAERDAPAMLRRHVAAA